MRACAAGAVFGMIRLHRGVNARRALAHLEAWVAAWVADELHCGESSGVGSHVLPSPMLSKPPRPPCSYVKRWIMLAKGEVGDDSLTLSRAAAPVSGEVSPSRSHTPCDGRALVGEAVHHEDVKTGSTSGGVLALSPCTETSGRLWSSRPSRCGTVSSRHKPLGLRAAVHAQARRRWHHRARHQRHRRACERPGPRELCLSR